MIPATEKGRASICVVNYKTELLTKLCLRSVRKFTKYPYEMIVVDNNSGDASLDYLRSVKWIRLIERNGESIQSGSWAHGSALDLGLDAAGGEFFVAMHSDTFVHTPGWLERLISAVTETPETACAGTGKLDLRPGWMEALKAATDIKKWLRKITGADKHAEEFYIRAICAVYKTDVLRAENLRFTMRVPEGVTCGKQLYFELLERKRRVSVISAAAMSKYIWHLAHATMVLNPEFTVRKRTEEKCRRSLQKILDSPLAKEILSDSSLDK
jgi:glycosyltransferase involved in cell wall biosynthesis